MRNLLNLDFNFTVGNDGITKKKFNLIKFIR